MKQKDKKNKDKVDKKSQFYQTNLSIFLIFLFITCIFCMSNNAGRLISTQQSDYSVPFHAR